MVITNAEGLCSVVFARHGATLVALGKTGTLREYAVHGGQLLGTTNWMGSWRGAAAQPGGRLIAALDAGATRVGSSSSVKILEEAVAAGATE